MPASTHDAHTPDRAPRLIERGFVFIVAAILAAPLLGMTLAPRAASTHEKRDLAPWPPWPATVDDWPATVEAVRRHLRDHVAWRSWLIELHRRLNFDVLGTSPSDAVWLGRNGWLYYLDDGAREDLLEPRLPDGYLDAWVRALDHTHRWLAQQGITYLVVIVPDKHVIYPEFLPVGIRPRAAPTRVDQVVTALRARTRVPLLDLRPHLRQAAQNRRIYHRTDTHWNDLGAFVGYQQIVGDVARRTPGVQPARPLSDFVENTTSSPGLDLAFLLGLDERLSEELITLTPRVPRRARVVSSSATGAGQEVGDLATEIADATLPRALVYRDSFATALIPFLAEHFSRTRFLWQRAVDPAVVTEERPAVVIHEIVGRRFGTHIPYDFAGPLLGATVAPASPSAR